MEINETKHAGLIQTYLTDDPHDPWVVRVISEFSLYSIGKTPVEAMQGLIDEAIPNYIECEKLAGNKVSWVLMDLYRDLKNKPLTKESPFNDANGNLIKTYASSIPDWV